MNHRLRKSFHLDTHTGKVTELPELTCSHDMLNGFYEIQAHLPMDNNGKNKGKEESSKKSKYTVASNQLTLPVAGGKRKGGDVFGSSGPSTGHSEKKKKKHKK